MHLERSLALVILLYYLVGFFGQFNLCTMICPLGKFLLQYGHCDSSLAVSGMAGLHPPTNGAAIINRRIVRFTPSPYRPKPKLSLQVCSGVVGVGGLRQ